MMTRPAGTRLGRYEIRSKIGEGGMGEVYLAQDTSEPGRMVALKIDGNDEAKPLTDFKTEKIFDFAWSLDGKQLAVIRGIDISDAVLISEEK